MPVPGTLNPIAPGFTFPPVLTIISPTDWSGSITEANKAQDVMPENPNRKGWWIQNTSEHDIWLSEQNEDAQIGQPFIQLLGGAFMMYEAPSHNVSRSRISVISAYPSAPFTAREWDTNT